MAMALAASCAWADISFERTPTGVVVRDGALRRTLDFYGPNTLRVKSDLGRDHWKHPSLAIIAKPRAVDCTVDETPDAVTVKGGLRSACASTARPAR